MRVPAAAALLLAALSVSGCYGPVFGGGSHHVTPEDYLKADYAKWYVEVDYAAADRPPDSLLSWVHDKLAPLVNKPGGVQVQTNDQLTGDASQSWTDEAILSYAKAHRSVQTGDGAVVTHLLFLAGHYTEDSVLAITYDYDLIVVFLDTMRANCTPLRLCTSPDAMMRAAVLHEFGHALGLVNRGTPMVHAHEAATCGGQPDHGHSTSTRSVMYCAVETSDIVALITNGGIPQDFDSDDKEDLHHAGGA